MRIELKALIEKLNPLCRRALERAAELCVSQTNYNVEVEHLFKALLDLRESDLHVILRHFKVDEARVRSELTAGIDRFKRGNARTPAFSPDVVRLLEAAWSISSLHLGSSKVRSGAFLMAALTTPTLRGNLQETAPSLAAINRESLEEALGELLSHSPEGGEPLAPGSQNRGWGGSEGEVGPAVGPSGQERALDRFTVDLTSLARMGGIDPITGRDEEIRQIVDILMRRRQNNPILTGEPGVGKTAIVEGFAMRVAARDVPEALQDATIRALDLGLLQAGAGIKGEFEHRLKSVIEEVKASVSPVILFIDEAHTIIGAGAPQGQGDAANLLKPALARGELRTIAATTWSEYKRYVEKDPALARRFQVIKVEEPDVEETRRMLRGMVGHLERHHGVRILEDAIRDAVELSHRHISGRKLPDKAVSVLDTACARVAIGRGSPPVQLDDAIREASQCDVELAVLDREQRAGAAHQERIKHLTRTLARAKLRRQEIEVRWKKESELIAEMDRVQSILDGTVRAAPDAEDDEPEALQKRLLELTAELDGVQGDDPLVPVCVDGSVVASVISGWTGIPVGKMVKNEIRTVLSLRRRMEERIVGQAEALEALCRRVGTSSAGLDDPNKPTGVFLFVGPSGVGKTETARALADFLYGGERNMVTVNMSEYHEAHTVSSLKGAPPGYVGFGTGGVLTEAVRRRPYSVVLLDEVEKAHPDVMELFYQVFDRGQMEDGEGQLIDFKHTLIILTSNVGGDAISELVRSSPKRPTAEQLVNAIRPELRSYFPAALLGRLITVPFFPLGDEEITEIVEMKLTEIQKRVWEKHLTELTHDPAVVRAVADRCTEVDSGARNIDSIRSDTLRPELSTRLLEYMAEGQALRSIRVGLAEDGHFAYQLGNGETTGR